MKQKLKRQSGFTLVELLVVISIMMMFFTIVLVGLNQQRVKRSVSIAQNETVTNIRKVQSSTLSSRNIGVNSKPVKYYIIQFIPGASTFTVRGVDSDYVYSVLETVNLKDGAVISALDLTDRSGAVKSTSQCAQVIFAAPFAKVYMDTTRCDSSMKDTVKNPVEMIDLTDANLIITLSHPSGPDTKTITVNGFSGKVIAN